MSFLYGILASNFPTNSDDQLCLEQTSILSYECTQQEISFLLQKRNKAGYHQRFFFSFIHTIGAVISITVQGKLTYFFLFSKLWQIC